MTDQSVLAAHVESLKDVAVLCIGDVMLDRFIYGDVERISPEAPIPVMRIRREAAMLGGAGNVVRNLVAIGAAPAFVAVVGDDDTGRDVAGLVGDHSSVDPCLVVEKGRQTTIKTRYVANSQQLLRADKETSAPLAPTSLAQVIANTETMIRHAAIVLLSDYGKGVLAPDVIRRVIDAARAAGKPVIVDPKGVDYTIYRGASLLTPNRKELQDATKMPVGTDEDIVAAARHLIESCDVEGVLATRSQDGMTLVTRGGEVHHLPAEAREVFDVSGAGDTVIATMAAAIGAGTTLVEAARLANVAAGIVVGKIGTAVAYAADIVTALHHSDLEAGEAKVLTLDAAQDRTAKWRSKGRSIGFTNGCFDLLHPGHISLLKQAKAACDRLVVGLNSDASVKRLKGDSRPVQSEAARATVLASLACVDMVVIFGEDTPERLIECLRPDLLVKGADYTVDKVVGADFVQSYGGKVLLADLQAGFSTTSTIARLTAK